MLVKPSYLYEDQALYDKIQKQKKDYKKNPSVDKINPLLNDFDNYSEKSHYILTKNNELALK